MGRFREVKRLARGALHIEFAVPALYYPVPSATPVPCTVRVLDPRKGPTMLGALPGGAHQQQYATVAEAEPIVIFLTSDVPNPRVNGVVSVEQDEAYRIQFAHPADGITITTKVTRLAKGDAQFATLALPA